MPPTSIVYDCDRDHKFYEYRCMCLQPFQEGRNWFMTMEVEKRGWAGLFRRLTSVS